MTTFGRVMRKWIKKYVPFVVRIFNEYARWKYRNKSVQQVFNEIYQSNSWEGEASVSGQGSDLQQTQTIRQALPTLFETYNIQSVLDVPCGDYYWMNTVDLSRVEYTGADIVEELVLKCQQEYGESNKQFVVLDVVNDPVKSFDLVFVRDCFVHLSFENIQKAIENIRKSQSKYLLTTTFPEKSKNSDITTGGWRWLNLQKDPFCFPEPLLIINEGCTEGKKFADKSMALWRISDLPQ